MEPTFVQNQATAQEEDRRMRAQAMAIDMGEKQKASNIAGYNQLNTMGTGIYNQATAPLTANQSIGQFALGGYGNIANMYNQAQRWRSYATSCTKSICSTICK